MNLLKARMIQSVTIKILFSVCLLVCTAGIHLKIGNSHSTFIIEQWKAEDQIIPILRNPITDITSILTDKQKAQLTNRLISFETKKGSQIAVLIVGSTGEWSIEEYAVKVFEKTELGRKGIDDGILIVVAIQDHKTKIEVGYGLEGIIPDVIAKRIIEEFMIPNFREGNYFQGISDGIDAIIIKINEEELPKTNISRIAEEKFPVVEQKNDFDKYVAFVPYVIAAIFAIATLIISGIVGLIMLIGVYVFFFYRLTFPIKLCIAIFFTVFKLIMDDIYIKIFNKSKSVRKSKTSSKSFWKIILFGYNYKLLFGNKYISSATWGSSGSSSSGGASGSW
ncbi:TPM domain-containing protein [Leptospira interrogans]|uniref:TPM domain-containing protein n=1 Tax=Leptospira interrogans TaxID=173 RepID=UPI0002BE4A73|nr:TPM domain-containing protein [Leptospira interrogans]EMN67489.1 PF04536 family protein [Leptospira interrogans serovar Grippotyphosa str. UI 08434]